MQCRHHGGVCVNPARAGMILSSMHSPMVCPCKPRASGDDPILAGVAAEVGA